MFTYNTRTEIKDGTTFIEQDVILFDYSYTGDMIFQVDAVLQAPGFGFIIKEDDGSDQVTADNIVLITLSNDGSYKVILKNGGEQITAVDQFIEAGSSPYESGITTLFFKKHNEVLTVYKGIHQDDGSFREIKLLTYRMQYDMDNYWIGIYSNAGNTVQFASVQTEAPSNWISNVINAGGGRIKWIRNGFTIDEAEYDIEVEAEDIWMKAGTYWFDYVTDNPDMKAYVYLSERKHTATKRDRELIRETMVDEDKNIVEADGQFTVPEDHAINIKFKGKWGTVKNICIKNDKSASFVETGYGTTTRPGGKIRFDLEKIKKIHMKATILSVPREDAGETRTYNLFRRGSQSKGTMYPVTVGTEAEYDFVTASGVLTINQTTPYIFDDPDKILYAFENVTAEISELIITLTTGEEINILLQDTYKITLPNTIASPVMVVDSEGEPLDLSASYRQVASVTQKLELFNALNPIHLSCYPDISQSDNIKVYGIPYSTVINNGKTVETIHKGADIIEELADVYTRIDYDPSPAALLTKSVRIPYDIRSKYQYIAVSYPAIVSFIYQFSNWEREIYDVREDLRIYLTAAPRNINEKNFVVYGIRDTSLLNRDLLYYVPDDDFHTSLDLCAWDYDILKYLEDYKVNALNKVIIDADTLKKYSYIIIDYLKKDSYTVNETKDYYVLDISTDDLQFVVYYDSEDGMTTKQYRAVTTRQMIPDNQDAIEENDFVVLELN